MRLLRRFVFLGLLVVCPPGSAWATPSEPFSFENADILTVVKRVGRLTGITFIFDPEQVTGKITLLSANRVSPAEALELLKSALALRGYGLLSGGGGGMWIVPAERLAPEAVTVKVVTLNYARADELAYTLSWVAPPWVRIIAHRPTNSLIISGHPAAVEELVDIIK